MARRTCYWGIMVPWDFDIPRIQFSHVKTDQAETSQAALWDAIFLDLDPLKDPRVRKIAACKDFHPSAPHIFIHIRNELSNQKIIFFFFAQDKSWFWFLRGFHFPRSRFRLLSLLNLKQTHWGCYDIGLAHSHINLLFSHARPACYLPSAEPEESKTNKQIWRRSCEEQQAPGPGSCWQLAMCSSCLDITPTSPCVARRPPPTLESTLLPPPPHPPSIHRESQPPPPSLTLTYWIRAINTVCCSPEAGWLQFAP